MVLAVSFLPAAARASGDGALEAVGSFFLGVLPVWIAAVLCFIASVVTLIKPARWARISAVLLAATSIAGGTAILIYVRGSAYLSTFGIIPLSVGVLCGAGVWARMPPPRASEPRLAGAPHPFAMARLFGRWVLAHQCQSVVDRRDEWSHAGRVAVCSSEQQLDR
ncbi:MAG TPA: hypothetical protein VFH73_13750 [Polyangia bacterium]|jgi:hypothetical protein|nr:hypothetical protein [Polyangia bacterium]